MFINSLKPAKLLLSNGRVFNGYSFGLVGETIGEVCFNTGMTGYQEILTDPSYCGQLITMTYPHIGNYGINSLDVESDKIQASGLIVKECSTFPSNYRSEGNLDDYLKQSRIVGIQGIDTRALVRCIRDEGAMNGIISSENQNDEFLYFDTDDTLIAEPILYPGDASFTLEGGHTYEILEDDLELTGISLVMEATGDLGIMYPLTIGFDESATDGYDEGIDFYAPPAPPQPSFDAALFWNGDR